MKSNNYKLSFLLSKMTNVHQNIACKVLNALEMLMITDFIQNKKSERFMFQINYNEDDKNFSVSDHEGVIKKMENSNLEETVKEYLDYKELESL